MKKEKLATFIWKGINRRGVCVKGELTGSNSAMIQSELKHQGIEIINLRKKGRYVFSFVKRIKTHDIVLFSRHLATMVSAGIPLVQALESISRGQSKAEMHQLIQCIKDDVASGKAFNESLLIHKKYFTELFINLIRTGEMSGTLDVILKRLAHYLEKTELLKKRIKKALFYPIAVLGIAIIIAWLLLVFIVPKFELLFSSFDVDLPFLTRFIINLSRFMQNNWYFILGAIGLSVLTFIVSRKHSKKLNDNIDYCILKIPLFGKLIHKAILARVTRTLSTLLTAGISMLDALNTASAVANNNLYASAIIQIREDVAEGQQLHTAINVSPIFPAMITQMVLMGEESGTLDAMLDKVATFYEEDVDIMVEGLSALIEPVSIVILSSIIGSFVLAMYLPIFRLGAIV